jgi:hypothetical protein
VFGLQARSEKEEKGNVTMLCAGNYSLHIEALGTGGTAWTFLFF